MIVFKYNVFTGPIKRKDDSIQSRYPSTGMSSEERWRRRKEKVQDRNWERDISGQTDEEPNITFMIIIVGVLFTIISKILVTFYQKFNFHNYHCLSFVYYYQ